MATIALSALRTLVLQLADMEFSAPAHVTTVEVNGRINEALSELRDLICEVQGQEYYGATSAAVSTLAGTSSYAVPADFYLLLGLRAKDGDEWSQVHPWEYLELAELESRSAVGTPTIYDYRYRLQDSVVIIKPTPRTAAHELYFDYVREFTPLTLDSSLFTAPHGWWKWASLKAAIDLLAKEDRDPTSLAAQLATLDNKIRVLGASRDIGRPPRIVDTRRDGDDFDYPVPYDFAKSVP